MKHGTVTAYKHYECRCDDCRRANRELVASQRDEARRGVRERSIILGGVPESEFGAWRERAACIGRTDIDWFPSAPSRHDRRGPGGRVGNDPSYRTKVERAKAVCATCPVIDDCRDAALATSDQKDHGIRGGLTQSERVQIRRKKGRT